MIQIILDHFNYSCSYLLKYKVGLNLLYPNIGEMRYSAEHSRFHDKDISVVDHSGQMHFVNQLAGGQLSRIRNWFA